MIEEDKKFLGLLLEGHRNEGKYIKNYFGIPAGNEELAVSDILSLLAEGFEVSLSNDLDEGHEGLTIFRMSPSGLEVMTGGHGWSSKWAQTEENEVAALVKGLAHLNRGGRWNTRASFRPN